MRDAAIDPHRQPRRPGAGRPASDRKKGDLSSAAIAAQRLGSALDRPPGRGGRPGRGAPASSRWRVFAPLRGIRPVKALTTAVFSAALVGIVANAVLFQKVRHPAMPFDGLRERAVGEPAVAAGSHATADSGPTGAVAPPSDKTVLAPVVALAPVTSDPSPIHRRSPSKHALAKPARGDAIGQLLNGRDGTDDKTTKNAEAKTTAAKPDPTLLRAQRQLKKLGYAVKPDGRMDGGTRQAIKRFAHDHHVKNEARLTPALTREIADASSAPVKPSATVPEQPEAR